VEAWLSQNDVPFTMRDVMRDPITEDEFARLIHDPQGRIVAPFTSVGDAVVLGFDPVRLHEYLDEDPNLPVVAHVRADDPSSDRLFEHLKSKGIAHRLRDVDAEPLSDKELWEMLTIPGRNIRTPYLQVDGQLVLGYDVPKLQRLLGLGA
jgi:arsenate reductase-like glutaredoxin family protein